MLMGIYFHNWGRSFIDLRREISRGRFISFQDSLKKIESAIEFSDPESTFALMPRQAIFILTDTQGSDVIGCYGRPEMRTPNIDRMATEGIRFDRAYSTQPVCGPARAALFTGLYPHSNGVLGNDMAPAIDAQTIGQRLTAVGIKTGYVGKWHLDGTDYFGNGICPEGWDPDYWFDGPAISIV